MNTPKCRKKNFFLFLLIFSLFFYEENENIAYANTCTPYSGICKCWPGEPCTVNLYNDQERGIGIANILQGKKYQCTFEKFACQTGGNINQLYLHYIVPNVSSI